MPQKDILSVQGMPRAQHVELTMKHSEQKAKYSGESSKVPSKHLNMD